MNDRPLYTGWGIRAGIKARLTRLWDQGRLSKEQRALYQKAERVETELQRCDLAGDTDWLVEALYRAVGDQLGSGNLADGSMPLTTPLRTCIAELLRSEAYFTVPAELRSSEPPRSELWALEDALDRTAQIVGSQEEAFGFLSSWLATSLKPLTSKFPSLLADTEISSADIQFSAPLVERLADPKAVLAHLIEVAFDPALDELGLAERTRARLAHNLFQALEFDLQDGTKALERQLEKLRTNGAGEAVATILGGTPFMQLFAARVPITLPQRTRFEHHHIVAGTGHGKTQMLQNLVVHDLEEVAAGNASLVVIDSQSDLIDTIAGLKLFAEGEPLHDRLCVIDPRDVEWPVALNLFDVGQHRMDGYSQLERERLTNGILELYDFVLGSLLDAGMTQKQAVIFRYITRLLLRIPNATIHTLRELLEDDGYEKYEDFINQLEGSAKAFFTEEFRGKEFQATKKQVLRRLYGILENQTFERMFSHPKSKLDLFSEMNAGKVILINTAKDLLKENGTQILGRFFIAMIAQAAQERAVLPKKQRTNTIVYVDEAQDYFDRNIGIILSQTRKYNVGMVLAHQFLGQLDGKLQEAIFANTSIKFAGGVSAKDARTLAADMHCEPRLLEEQPKLSFAAYIKGQTKQAASIAIPYGIMEDLPRLSAEEQNEQRQTMRAQYAIHFEEAQAAASRSASEPVDDPEPSETATDDEWWEETDSEDEQPWQKWGDFRDEELPEHKNDKAKKKPKKPKK